jgi:pentatricopeptide repeat protein
MLDEAITVAANHPDKVNEVVLRTLMTGCVRAGRGELGLEVFELYKGTKISARTARAALSCAAKTQLRAVKVEYVCIFSPVQPPRHMFCS